MQQCLELARAAAAQDEVPVGAVVVIGDEVVGVGRNRVEERGSPIAHAEIEALQAQLKYYDPAVHAAAFVLPRFAEAVVSRSRQPALPHVCSSVAPTLLSRRSLALAAAGALVGAAALAAVRRR